MTHILLYSTQTDWRTPFGITFIVILLGITIYTLYQTYKTVLSHNEKERELQEVARKNIRVQQLTNMVLRNTKSFLWNRENGEVHISNAFREHLGIGDAPVGLRSNFEMTDYYWQKLQEFLHIDFPGDYTLQIYAGAAGRQPHWFEVRMHVEQTENGPKQSGISLMIDEQKEREAIELETHRMILNVKESENFISSVNHEIRTPLNVIVGLSQLFCDPNIKLTEEEVKQFAIEIDKSNTLLMKMINDMLTVTLMDNSNIGFSLEETSLKDFVSSMKRLEREESIRLRNTQIVIEEGNEDAIICIDHKQMEHVMLDIVDNASKFSPEGSKVTLSWKTEDHNAMITIKDNGIGIEPVYQSLIFHRFYKIDPFTTGTGLGLALAQIIMERMGGTIGVVSKPGVGSTFWILLKKMNKTMRKEERNAI